LEKKRKHVQDRELRVIKQHECMKEKKTFSDSILKLWFFNNNIILNKLEEINICFNILKSNLDVGVSK